MNPVNKILLGVGAVVALALTVVFVWLSLTNAHLKTALAEANASGTACHLANDDFVAKIAQQNKAVEQLKAESALREKRAEAAAEAAQEVARTYFVAADTLRKAKPRGDRCKAADAVLNAYIGGGK
ncbi:MAG: hypothetical protein P4M13_09610 [Alphaproteobacteria bacterium]|nr:hypothetical protein [Alphaproteobacteria bacterium]